MAEKTPYTTATGPPARTTVMVVVNLEIRIRHRLLAAGTGAILRFVHPIPNHAGDAVFLCSVVFEPFGIGGLVICTVVLAGTFAIGLSIGLCTIPVCCTVSTLVFADTV
jgi:hypothetical protein